MSMNFLTTALGIGGAVGGEEWLGNLLEILSAAVRECRQKWRDLDVEFLQEISIFKLLVR